MATKKSNGNSKPYVNYSTIQKNVGFGFSNPGEGRIFKIGKHKVLVSRAERLDYYGNPVHTATVINPDGSLGASCKSTGNASFVVSLALKKSGVETRYKRTYPRK